MATPSTFDSVHAVADKVADARADILVGQGHIIKNSGDNTSAILRDANGNALMTGANIDRGLIANLQEANRNADKLGLQANTVAWNQSALQDAGFAAVRTQADHLSDSQGAFADRNAKYQAGTIADSFARLSAQGENGFARELDATTNGTRQTVQSEMGVTRSLADGFRDGSAASAANYANLSAQSFGVREVVANYGNRSSDQAAALLASLTGQHTAATRDLFNVSKEIVVQSSLAAAATQLEAAKNAAALGVQASAIGAATQLEASKNAAAAQLQAAMVAKDAALQAAVNSKESLLQASFLAKDSLLEQSKWFALAEKTAMVNKCEIESKMAECCCEIKQAVVGTSNATQALIQSNEAIRAREALAIAATENAVHRLRREERRDERPYPYPYPFPFPRSDSPRRERNN